MVKSKNIFRKGEIASCLFMVFALLWLTVSLPFVNYTQEILEEQVAGNSEGGESNQQNLPTEEKTESGSNTLSEYLHDHHHEMHQGDLINTGYKIDPDDTYLAFHPDLVLLPPEA